MTRGTWELGWWAPVPPALEPDELVEPVLAQPVQRRPVGHRRQQGAVDPGLDQLIGLQRRRHRGPPPELPGRPTPASPGHLDRLPNRAETPLVIGCQAVAGAVRLRVALGSTLMPGPIEVATVMPLM